MTPFSRSLLFGIGALALIAGVFVGAIWLRSGTSVDKSKAVKETTMVLIAARPIDAGALLRASDVIWRSIGTSQPLAGSFVRGINTETELIGALARRKLSAGEVLTKAALLRPDERGFLAATLVPGFRAVTIAVDATQSASGLVLPGDRVDVILVQKIDSSAPARKSVGETVLTNARVVAVGHALGAMPSSPTKKTTAMAIGDGQSSDRVTPQTITLEAQPLDAQRLLVAGEIGTLGLALRPVGEPDDAAPPPVPVWAGDVSTALRGTAAFLPPFTPMSPSKRPSFSRGSQPVLIIHGSGGDEK